MFEKAPIGILITDQEGVIHEASPRAAQYLDIPLHNLIGHTIFEQLDEQERVQQLAIYADNYAKRKTIQQHELTLQDRIGNKRDIAISSDFIEMEGEAFQLLMIYDITETKRRERQIHQLAYYDHLTGLYNRASFHEAFEEWQHTRKEFVLILFDLDAFKTINDRYGHLAGDQALKHFATLLAGSVEEGDIVARMSGDEFVILLSRTESTEKVIQSIKMRLRQPYELSGGHLVKLSVSIGTALYPVDGMTLDEVFKIADDRMYAIKHVRQTRANT